MLTQPQRLKRLLELAMKETDPVKRDELSEEIWRALKALTRTRLDKKREAGGGK